MAPSKPFTGTSLSVLASSDVSKPQNARLFFQNTQGQIVMASNDEFLGNWAAAAPINQSVPPQSPTPVAAIQGKNMEWISLFFYTDKYLIYESYWTLKNGWNTINVLADDGGPVKIQPKTLLTALVVDPAKDSVRIFYHPENGQNLQSIKRVGIPGVVGAADWSAPTVLPDLPLAGTRIAAVAWTAAGHPNIRAYYQGTDREFVEAAFTDTGDQKDDWTRGALKIPNPNKKTVSGLAANVIPGLSSAQLGWIRVYVAVDNNLIQYLNKTGDTWEDPKSIGEVIKTTRLTALSYKDGNDIHTSVYAQDAKTGNLIPFIISPTGVVAKGGIINATGT